MKEIWSKYKIYIITVLAICLLFVMYFLPSWSNFGGSSGWDGVVASSFAGGNGTPENPYLISNASEFAYLKSLLENKEEYVLYNDKSYVITKGFNYGKYDLAIKSEMPFKGTIDGQRNIITNATLTSSLFQSLEEATIQNINFNEITLNIEEEKGAFLAKKVTKSNLSFLVINANVNTLNCGELSGFIYEDTESTYTNIIINNTFKNVDASSIATMFITSSNSKVDNLLIKNESYAEIINNNETVINNKSSFKIVGDKIKLDNEAILTSFTNDDFDLKINKDMFIIQNNHVSEVAESITKGIPKPTFELHDSGISGNTMYVNDLDADWNYYQGKNYVSSDGTLPSGDNQNLYSLQSMVRVMIIYNGSETNANETLVGTISETELESKMVYYKWVPVENGQIKIQLIDNPFTNRPKGKGFNNWVSETSYGKISFDVERYGRHITVPVAKNATGYEDIVLSFHASWVKAEVSEVATNTSWTSVFDNFYDKGLHKLETVYEVCDPIDMTGYFREESASYGDRYTGYDERGNTVSTTCRSWWGGCTYYSKIENENYVEGETYYELRNGYMTEVDPGSLPIHCETFENTDFINQSMAGYYVARNFSYGASYDGYYDNTGALVSGSCRSSNCVYYELLQAYDDYLEPIFDPSKEYFYMVTRDTNLAVLVANNSTIWASGQSKPFTFTGLNNGVQNNSIWNVSNKSLKIYNDTTIENMTVRVSTQNSNSNPSTSSNNIVGNYNNLKLGRGLKRSGNYATFNTVVAGGSQTGSNGNDTLYHIMIESGFYNSISLTYQASNYGSSSIYIDMDATIGNDYDRILANNNNLLVYYCLGGSWGGTIRSSRESGINSTIKSGSFGTSKYDLTTGIYVGGRYGGTHYTARSIKVEGGWIYNVIGGPLTASNRSDVNDTYIYQTGGEIDMITGGAGQTATYGNRIISLTGGRVNYSVFAGSNGSTGSGDDGTLNGTGFIYVGGNAIIGNETLINNNSTLFGSESGSVFGIGNGKSGSSSIGSSDNSNIIIDGEATILNSVYGGGNFGATGVNSSSSTNYTNIKILGGTINKNVYGGGNQNGSGSSAKTSTINILMTGGKVLGNIYGGANILGTVYGSVNLKVEGGEVSHNVYGGGKGNTTFIKNKVNVQIGNATHGPTIQNNVYGGSALGTVNGENTTTLSNDNTEVIVNNGVIKGSVFGGGEGNATYIPYVLGNIKVTIQNGNISYVFGGNDQAGTPSKTVEVYLVGGTIGSVYGGGNNSSVPITNVYQQGSNTTYLFGGSNKTGNVTKTNILVTGGTTGSIFGGNDQGGSVSETVITFNGGTLLSSIYGGGNKVATVNAFITLNNAQGVLPNVYGGGKSANVTNVKIEQNGPTVTNLFGGSDASGNVLESNIIHHAGQTTNIYGGNNAGGNTLKSTITYETGNSTNIFAGGNKTNSNESSITIQNGTIENIYGGGNEAGLTNAIISIHDGTIGTIYGGSNKSGTVQTTTMEVFGGTITSLFGGNNAGGITEDSKIKVHNGTIDTIYGGGNLALSKVSNIFVDDGKIKDIFGGGNEASIETDTLVDINGGTILHNIYGGGNFGIVDGSTKVTLTNVSILGSAYAGGNGSSALVKGNTTIEIDGNTVIGTESSKAPLEGSVFGGGNAAPTGEEATNKSIGSVNILGGTIYGNVYGGANTSVLYGTTSLKIGYHAVTTDETAYQKNDIYIKGTIFGGGEANAGGDENYDYSFISVTKGIDILLDGSGNDKLNTKGSIFGSGNASSTSGESKITIKNYGDFHQPEHNISIQRTNLLTVDNSNIALSGAKDRTNEYSDVLFSLSIIDQLKLQNNSTLFMENGANLLRKMESLTKDGSLSEVTIDSEKREVTKNVDNRIYMLEGRNLNVATNESVTSYGEIYGMTFFGMFTYDRDNNPDMGIYDPKYNIDDPLDWGGMPVKGSYILGLHKTNHDITKDGFYSNFMAEETSTNDLKYITPTPEDSNFYMWIIGEAVAEYDVDLIASKYSTLGATELTFLEFAKPNTSFQILGVDDSELGKGINLKDKNDIPKLASNATDANNNFGLVMESSNSGWLTRGETSFLTTEPKIKGTTYYVGENSTVVPSLLFYLYHSKNLTESKDMGTIHISIMAITVIDALTSETERLNINVNLSSALYQTNEYEAAMTPGRKYEMFTSTSTNITTNSSLSAYYALYGQDTNLYKDGYYRALTSTYALPENTKITMLDFIEGSPKYYYHTITKEEELKAQEEINLYGEASYHLSMFTNMGSLSTTTHYNDAEMNKIYYKNGSSSEEFIFIVDYQDTTINEDQLSKSLIMELRNNKDQTIISVLGIQHSLMQYSLYKNKDSVIGVNATIDKNPLYVGHNATINVQTNYQNLSVGVNTIYDTQYFDSKLGLQITLKDNEGNTVTGNGLLGAYFLMNGKKYYPNVDGTTRLKLADKVGNIESWLVFNTENASIATGSYTLEIETFGSPDGIYYGNTTSAHKTIPLTIINSIYGLKSEMNEEDTIINTSEGSKYLKFKLAYSSGLANPSLRMTISRRKYDNVYDTAYESVDLQEMTDQTLFPTANPLEYLLIQDPKEMNEFSITLKDHLITGTYRLEFKLYDSETLIGETKHYIIIK